MERLREELKASRAAKAEAAKAEKEASADVTMAGTTEETKPLVIANGALAADDNDVKQKERVSASPAPVAAKIKVIRLSV